jgi:hypothetical protein
LTWINGASTGQFTILRNELVGARYQGPVIAETANKLHGAAR